MKNIKYMLNIIIKIYSSISTHFIEIEDYKIIILIIKF